MWMGALAACTVFSAVLLIIILARIEAGTGAKPGWLVLTFCSLAAVAALIFFKPEAKMDQVQYMPAPLPAAENGREERPEEMVKEAVKKEALQPAEKPGGESSSSTSLIKENRMAENLDQRDPLLEEILLLKKQALEKKKEAASGGTPAGPPAGESGADGTAGGEQAGDSGNGLEEGREENLPPEGQTGGQNAEEIVYKARVLVAALNVRSRGSLDGAVVSRLNAGDLVKIVGKSGDGEWVQIELNNGQTGWVMRKYIEEIAP
ncbi:MAG: SH3 domain-containing protein [Pelotomaculum sp.]|uniref:Hypothetical membrane protein n=1 Tax=Pelotomaculum thermopropionicum (strain DSM 13744 / JCM 10971 / SI) TaxID=370438 RepID=A5D3B2_PELTS|nr:SH3 domain-containing protein [Pelotomaculum sp.]BAF59273.1 hypothetical membrane protein [Pelotomaculum thermopropionicum SI]